MKEKFVIEYNVNSTRKAELWLSLGMKPKEISFEFRKIQKL
jgi:hypothetical protein